MIFLLVHMDPTFWVTNGSVFYSVNQFRLNCWRWFVSLSQIVISLFKSRWNIVYDVSEWLAAPVDSTKCERAFVLSPTSSTASLYGICKCRASTCHKHQGRIIIVSSVYGSANVYMTKCIIILWRNTTGTWLRNVKSFGLGFLVIKTILSLLKFLRDIWRNHDNFWFLIW